MPVLKTKPMECLETSILGTGVANLTRRLQSGAAGRRAALRGFKAALPAALRRFRAALAAAHAGLPARQP